jgi:hypothetical protein
VFGATTHRYRLGPPVDEARLAGFEAAERVGLPADYREFLGRVGDGGAGPAHGLRPFAEAWRACRPAKRFPHTRAVTERRSSSLIRDLGPGLLEIGQFGCGGRDYLVVNGPAHGTVWTGNEEVHPTGLSFGAWYRRWLELALRGLANQRRLDRLRVGLSAAEVGRTLPAEWQERRARVLDVGDFLAGKTDSREAIFLEAVDVPAQLELDAAGRVVKVTPLGFISADPARRLEAPAG